jgi:hypothetical protein
LNRAACNLELGAASLVPHRRTPSSSLRYLENYGSVLRDCASVITANPRPPSKAYYRAGLALLALERPDEALDVCTRAGEVATDDVGFKTLRARAEEKCRQMARKADERRERARRAAEEKRRMDVAFAVRVFSLF